MTAASSANCRARSLDLPSSLQAAAGCWRAWRSTGMRRTFRIAAGGLWRGRWSGSLRTMSSMRACGAWLLRAVLRWAVLCYAMPHMASYRLWLCCTASGLHPMPVTVHFLGVAVCETCLPKLPFQSTAGSIVRRTLMSCVRRRRSGSSWQRGMAQTARSSPASRWVGVACGWGLAKGGVCACLCVDC